MKVLVTGASGYLGGHVCKALADAGHSVSALVRSAGQARDSGLRRYLTEAIEGRIEDQVSLQEVKRKRFDAVIHLAAKVNAFATEEELSAVNVAGTGNILGVAAAVSAEKFIFASSIEAMGPVSDPGHLPDEGGDCLPVSAYGRSKLEAERLVNEFNTGGRIERTIFRVGNVYGPPRGNFILPVISAIDRRDELYRYLGSFCDRRLSLVHADDAAAALMLPLAKEAHGVFILCGSEPVTWGGLFGVCGQSVFGRKPEVPSPAGSPVPGGHGLLDYIFSDAGGRRIHRAYSNRRIREELGFVQSVNAMDGIPATIDYLMRAGVIRRGLVLRSFFRKLMGAS